MGKRFVDTEIWEKGWFMGLDTSDKLAMLFVLTKCDNVGVWNHNKPLADILIGTKTDWDDLQKRCSKHIEILKNGKWWVKDFVDFQWGELNDKSPPHKSYIKLLKRHDLYDRVTLGYAYPKPTLTLGYQYPTSSPKEKKKEKEKTKDKYKEKDIIPLYICYYSKGELNGKVPTLNERKYLEDALEYQSLEEWKPYCDEMNRQVSEGSIENRVPMKFFFGDRFHQFEPKEDSAKRIAREMGLEK